MDLLVVREGDSDTVGRMFLVKAGTIHREKVPGASCVGYGEDIRWGTATIVGKSCITRYYGTS